MDSAVDRHAFYISDGAAITAEVLGHAVMSRFPVTISSITPSFIESESRVRATKDRINAIYHQTNVRPLVFYSIMLLKIRAIILQNRGFCQDIIQALVAPLRQEMKLGPAPIAHRTHDLNPNNLSKYDVRITATDCILAHDDGVSLRNPSQTQVILLGVSRRGKTPTSLYLAIQFGIRTANYLFIADGMGSLMLPASLKPLQHKLFGLTVDPEHLTAIREERQEGSHYASLRQCRMEVAEMEALYRKNQIPRINSTNYSVEEIATKIFDIMGLSRRMY